MEGQLGKVEVLSFLTSCWCEETVGRQMRHFIPHSAVTAGGRSAWSQALLRSLSLDAEAQGFVPPSSALLGAWAGLLYCTSLVPKSSHANIPCWGGYRVHSLCFRLWLSLLKFVPCTVLKFYLKDQEREWEISHPVVGSRGVCWGWATLSSNWTFYCSVLWWQTHLHQSLPADPFYVFYRS